MNEDTMKSLELLYTFSWEQTVATHQSQGESVVLCLGLTQEGISTFSSQTSER